MLSALGLLVSNLKAEFSRTCLQPARRYDLARLASTYAALQAEAEAWLARENVPRAAQRIEWLASLRYEHQGFELTVPWAGSSASDEAVAATVVRFHELHRALYTFAQEDTPVEIVTLRVDAVGALQQPRLVDLPPGGDPASAIAGRQRIALAGGEVEAPIYDRAKLGAGARLAGPAIVTQLDATTLILPAQTAEVHKSGSLIVSETG